MPIEAVTLFEGDLPGEALDLGEYRLQKGCEGEIKEPLEACEKLYVVAHGQAVALVNDYGDLCVYVNNIGTTGQAEQFLRLPTSLETFHLFRRGKVEIDCEFVERYRPPVTAQLDSHDAKRFDLHPLEIFRVADGYRIRRCLYVWKAGSNSPQLHRVEEHLGFDGSYRRILDRLVSQGEVWRTLPVYE
jgi:hypothetical protein